MDIGTTIEHVVGPSHANLTQDQRGCEDMSGHKSQTGASRRVQKGSLPRQICTKPVRSTQQFGLKFSELYGKRMSSVRESLYSIWLIIDYSIHFFEPLNLLIAHMRYIGSPENMQRDLAEVGENEATRRWWKVCRSVNGLRTEADCDR